MNVKATVSISKSEEAFARAMVEQGRYASISDVVQHGLELLRAETEQNDCDEAALRKLLMERAKGPFITMEESRRETKAMLARKRAELGL